MNTAYVDIIKSHWDSILELYKQFEDKKPVMLFDLKEHEIFAYPYEDFKAELSQNSQISLEKQYQRALENNYMVIFVRDDIRGKMASYSLEIEEE